MKAKMICFADEVSYRNQSCDEIAKCWTLNRSFEGELSKPDIGIPWDKIPFEKIIA